MTKQEAEDTAGSLKVHVKLALEVDIRITARIKGDIAIGESSAPAMRVGSN